MRSTKLVVIALFTVFVIAIYAFTLRTERVSGNSTPVAISSPTGVTASDGDYATKIGIHWDAMRGATLYRIFRNTTNLSAGTVEVGSTPANYFFDTTPIAGQTYFYWVRADNGGEQSGLGGPNQGTRAVGLIAPGPFAPLDPPPAPAGNDLTAAKSYLGKTLFWDEQLSSTRTVACGTCHRPAAGGSDPRTAVNSQRSTNPGVDGAFGTADDVFGSPGVPQNLPNGTYEPQAFFGFNEQVTGRKSPSYLNSGYSSNGLFWDGRASDIFRDQLTNNIILTSMGSLESQSAGPPVSSAEMAHGGRNWTEVAERIQSSKPLALATDVPTALATWIDGRTYPQLFLEAFGTADVTPARISMAIASHERTLFSDNTPLDRWAAQIEPLTVQEEAGRSLFVNLQCNTCHDGALLSNNQFHNIGVRPADEDKGLGGVTMDPADNGRFRTPTLRNVELHAPYMHNGRFATLEEVIDFYDRGGDFDAPNIDHGVIHPLGLSPEQKADLVAFMKRPLTDQRVKNELPPFDRPGLYTESVRVPVITGSGRAGTGSFTPGIIAISPPLAGNPDFTVSVSGAMGASAAVLVIDEVDPGVGTTVPAAGSLARITTTTHGSGAGNGWASVSVTIPDSQAIGRTYHARWYVQDPGAANGFSVSQAARFTVFGTVPLVDMSGRVFTPSGLGLRNAIVTLTFPNGQVLRSVTSSFGVYGFFNLPAGFSYTVGVSSKRYRFAARVVTPATDLTNFDFTGLE